MLASNRKKKNTYVIWTLQELQRDYDLSFQTLPVQIDRQATMTGINPSRLLKTISTEAEIESRRTVWCQKCNLNRQLPHWQVTACASGDMLNMSSPRTALFSTFLFLLHDGIQSSHPNAVRRSYDNLAIGRTSYSIHPEIICWISY